MKKFAVLMFALVIALAGMSAQASTVLMDPSTNNGSFESPALVPGSVGVGGSGTFFYQFTTPAGWTFVPNGEGNGDIAVQTIGTTGDGSVTVVAPTENGSQFATICGSGWLYQSGTCGNFQANTIYTLNGYGTQDGAAIPEIAMGNGQIGFASALSATPNYTFTAFSPITIDTRVETNLIGLPIDVVCRSVQGVTSGTYAMFDNITLTATSVPEPVTMILLALGGLFLRRK